MPAPTGCSSAASVRSALTSEATRCLPGCQRGGSLDVTALSKLQVSVMAAGLDEGVEAFRARGLMVVGTAVPSVCTT